jgi:hypothetical protein
MTSVESDQPFRLARLILLLAVVEELEPAGVDAERLGVYDFLAANPLLVARDEGDPDRLTLRLAGFDDRALGYASPAHRFATGQLRLPADLGRLVAHGLVTVTVAGRIRYRLTPRGRLMAGQFTAMYARSYTAAAGIVVRRLRRLSGRKLRDNLRDWLTVTSEPHHGRLDPVDAIETRPTMDGTSSTGTAWRTGFPEDET